MTRSDGLGEDNWLGPLLRRFDPSWMPSEDLLAVDRVTRSGLQRISIDHPEERLARLITFYRSERPKLLAFARARLGSNADLADDLLQEVMRKVCQKPPVMREPDKEAPFFYQSIRNEAVTLGTRASRERAGRDNDEHAAAQVPDPAAAFEDPVEFHLLLARALASLAPRGRALVELVDIQGMTVKDAAEELGIAVGTAQRHRFDALRRLREDPGLNDLRLTIR